MCKNCGKPAFPGIPKKAVEKSEVIHKWGRINYGGISGKIPLFHRFHRLYYGY